VLIPAQDLGVPWSENHGFQHALRRMVPPRARGFRDFAIDHYPKYPATTPFLEVYRSAGAGKAEVLEIAPEDRRTASGLSHPQWTRIGMPRWTACLNYKM
jgi:hypothetical protein